MKKIALFVLSLALMLGVFSSLTAQNLLWTEDFGATAPTGWTVVNAGNGNDWSLTATGYPHTGSHHMQYGYNNYNPANTWAFTPGIFMTAGNDYYLTFYQRVRGSGYPENLKVTVGNAQTVASQTTTLLDLPSVTNTTYTQRTTAYYRPTTTNIYYFAFNCYSATNMWYLYVDLVQAYEIDNSGIANPTSFTATASSATQIDLSWALNSTPDNVLLAWNTTNTFGTPSGSYTAGDAITGGGTVLLANSSATSFNHTGLTPNTTYYYRIWSQNGAGPTYSGGAAANATTFMAPITSFPWTETFETTSSTRAGWSQIQETGTQSWTWATGSSGGSITTAHDGTLNARYTGSTYNGHITKLVTPTLDLSGVTNPTLSFWYGQQAWGSDQNTLAIYYRTSPTGAWTQIGSDYTSNISSWTQVTGIFLPNPSATYQLAFEGTDNYGYANVLDDVVVSGFSGVLDPTTFTATAVSSTQIDLSWVLNSTPDNVLLAWNTTNTFGTPSGSYTAGSTITGGGTVLLANSNATSYNHSGLNPNTTYYYMIWSQNGTGPTYSSGVDANATTPMAPVTSFPWAETFETTSSTRDGWSQIQETGTKSWTWATGSSAGSITTAHGGTLNARFTSSSGGPWVTKLVTPTLDLSGVSNPTLSFWYGQEAWYSDQNTLAIYYRTSPTGAWTQIGSDYTGNISSWTQVTGILLPNPSSTYQLAFEGTDNYGRANVLDDVVVSGFSGVLDPTSFTATAVSSTQIDLSWVLNSTPDNVLLAWNTTNTFGTPSGSYTAGDAITGGGTVLLANSSATSYNHSGLNPNTTYYYMIWSQNGAGPTYSNGVDANATTQAPPITSFPFTESFDGTAFPPTGWTLDTGSYPWIRVSTGIYPNISPYAGDGMAKYSCYDYYTGSTGLLITPPLNLPSDGFTASFWMYRDTGYSGNADLVNVYYNTTNSLTGATLLGTVNRNTTLTPAVSAEGWYKYFFNLPSGSSGNGRFVIFEGVSAYGNNIYVDEIEISIPSPELTLSESSYNFGLAFVNASNCTPRYFIAENTGVGTATIASAPQFTGTDASQFTLIDTNTYPIALNASEYAYWGVKFEPSSYGEKTAY
ncbi:MAG: choice-of-anchor J domain-containing protein, partial [Candidatus Cloacimonadota bacterium]|nr:choice-of-anchor J domain-containing protein [Candidatus Cloacimonadota bacterium]